MWVRIPLESLKFRILVDFFGCNIQTCTNWNSHWKVFLEKRCSWKISKVSKEISKNFQRNFKSAQKKENKVSKPGLLKSIVHNFSSNNLTQRAHEALSYGLGHHIPTNINRNNIKTEFESFFQKLLHDLSDMPENEISKVEIIII